MKRKRVFPHIESLDGLRAMAVLAVFFHHTVTMGFPKGNWDPLIRWIYLFSAQGYLGVDLFFVLSGYLITTLLLLDRRNPNGYRNFYVKRAFRILPPLFAALAFAYLSGYLNLVSVALGLLFVTNYGRIFRIPVTGPYWTLSIEEQFYLGWPWVVRSLKVARLCAISIAILFAEPCIRFVMNYLGHGTSYFTFVRCDGLAWGALFGIAAYCARLYTDAYRARAWWKRYGRWILGAGAALSLGMTALLRVYDLGLQENTLKLTVAPIFFAGILMYLVCDRESPLSRFLRLRPLRYLGEVSYTFYLIHMTVIFLYDRRWPLSAGHAEEFWIRTAATLGIVLILSALSLHIFERPMLRLRSRFLR